MNAEDKARLLELKIHVWAHVAKALLEKGDRPYTMFQSEIEFNRGRWAKALRLLNSEGILKALGKELYEILKFDEAKELATKPVFDLAWHKSILVDVYSGLTEAKTINSAGYLDMDMFSKTEILYIYFHQDEFNAIKFGYEDRNDGFYLKELETLRNKMILKSLLEIELQNNFPQYVQHYAGYKDTAIQSDIGIEFEFKKYAMSSVFVRGEFASIYDQYKANADLANDLYDAFNKTSSWVDSVGGYPEAIKIIRKQIIQDFIVGHRRFSNYTCLDTSDNAKEYKSMSYKPMFDFVAKNKSLFSYEALYLDPALDGEEVQNLRYAKEEGQYSWNRVKALEPVKLKEEFDEPEDKGDDSK